MSNPAQSLLASLDRLVDDPAEWPHLLEQMRFLQPGVFQAVWFRLITAQTLQARQQGVSDAGRQRLAALWKLADQKLRQIPAGEAAATLPLDLILWLLGDYFEVWGELDYWEGWLRSYYAPALVLDRLATLLPFVPCLKPASRRRLLALAIALLEPAPELEAHLDLLGELADAARRIGAETQTELLLAEMPLLLEQLDPEAVPRTAFGLAINWLGHGHAREARFALARWQKAFRAMPLQDQHWEVRQVLSSLNWYILDLVLDPASTPAQRRPGQRRALNRKLPLESFNLLHSWLQRTGDWIIKRAPAQERFELLCRLLQIGYAWELPEVESWQAALGLAPAPPLISMAAMAYAHAMPAYMDGGLAEAEALAAQLPAWLRRWGTASALPLLDVIWPGLDELEQEGRALVLQLQTAAELLGHSPGKSRRARRQQLLAWGMALMAPLRESAQARLRKRLNRAFSNGQKLLQHPSAENAADLSWTLSEAVADATHWHCTQQVLAQGVSVLKDWIQAVLALPADELESEHLLALRELVSTYPAGWERWQLRLALASGLPGHLPWEQVEPLWQSLFESWSGLDQMEQLQAMASLGMALVRVAFPARSQCFDQLHQLALDWPDSFRDDALTAVGHCRIRAGELEAGLASLACIAEPSEQLRALMQVGSVLNEVKDRTLYPQLIAAMLDCAARQSQPQLAWQAYGAAALACWIKREPDQSLQILSQGLEHLL